MSDLSNNQGRAYEYICLLTIHKEVIAFRKATIIYNSSFIAAQKAWNNISTSMQALLSTSAAAIVNTLFDMEPLILESKDDNLDLMLQPDKKGSVGDVRDILIIRQNIQWEIGLSLKHNHFAVKHSRLSKTIDFGKRWFGIPCSTEYWNDVLPIFHYLEKEKLKKIKWSELPNKEIDIYVPLLKAFVKEIKQSNKTNDTLPKKMVEYLLGEFDFYKVISIDAKKRTRIEGFNLHGSLNRNAKYKKPNIRVPIVSLPSRIAHFDFKPNSNNTVEMYLDGGWQFSFRIHNASTFVEESLKFDIQIIGMPTSIITIECLWH